VKRGLSFSARERHCVFLNKGDGKFADVSTITGLDLPDDGRGSAQCDWDHDGDIDLWVSNRNAPTVRFFENKSAKGGFVSIKLEGRECNRDAIGARLRLVLKGNPKPILRTLRAGDGFLSQSSKRVHFGIGDTTEIEFLMVRWPGGDTETIAGLEVNKSYRVAQGTGVGVKWSRPRSPSLAEGSTVEIPQPSSAAAITSLSRIAMPPLHYRDLNGKSVSLFGKKRLSRPILINLWATWCAPCLKELGELNDRSNDLKRAGVDIVALCVDPTNDLKPEAPSNSPADVVKKLGVTFPAGIADSQLVDTLQMVHNLMFDIHVPLPLPCSFLVDAGGRLLVLYKGPLDVDDLIADATTRSKLRGSDRRKLTEQFSGKWLSKPRVLNFYDLAAGMFEHGYTDDAILFYQRNSNALSNHPRAAHMLVLLGNGLEKNGHFKEALGTYRLGLEKAPSFSPALSALALLLASCPDPELRDPPESVKVAEQAVRANNGQDTESFRSLAAAYEAAGRSGDAKAVLKELEKIEQK
jgi:thiol-disulfide isomerase/thioredoxin